MEIRYRISDTDGKIVFCNLHPNEAEKIETLKSNSQRIPNSKLRGGLESNKYGTIVAFTSDKDFVRSSSKFSTAFRVIVNSTEMLNSIIDQANNSINKSTSRLIHNLTSLNGHNIQEIYSLVPQENVSQKIKGQLSYVEEIVKKNPRETASTLLRIAKNNAAMKAEFSVFKKLFETTPELQTREHNVHKVLMNIFYLFFSDFTDKNVRVRIADDGRIHTAFFDYESFHVALYHVIENTAKYIKQKTNLDVRIIDSEKFVTIEMDMKSLEIKSNEIERIFDEGYSGETAFRAAKAGDGIGMNRARKILELNHGNITVTPHYETIENAMGLNYQRNVFSINLPKQRPRAST